MEFSLHLAPRADRPRGERTALGAALVVIAIGGGFGSLGCGSSPGETKTTAQKPKSSAKASSGAGKTPKLASKPNADLSDLPTSDKPKRPREAPAQRPSDGPQLADLLKQSGAPAEKTQLDKAPIPLPESPPLDEDRAAASGIRKIQGQVLTLYTDLPADPEFDELPAVFEKAVPQWCAYFGLDPAKAARWKPRAYLMKEKERFEVSGLLPADLPPFLHGFQRGNDLWLYEQPSAFYRRHLLLHEGTHGFMNVLLGGAGPPWYMEGTAEMLGTHLWKDGALTLGYIPKSNEESPYWGRVKSIKDETAAGRGLMLSEIFGYDNRAHLKREPYGWCWGAATFLDRHPLTQQAFRDLRKDLRDQSGRFSARFLERLKGDWPKIVEQWQLFVHEIEYGYDVERAAIDYRAGRPLATGNDTASLAADRGWQSSGIRLEAGVTYHLSAEGRYQIGIRPKTWWCEPGGVTVHYYRGRPLGMLLGAVRPDEENAKELTPLVKPEPIGLATDITPPRSGTLYLKINDSAADLGDNKGSLTVKVQAK